MWNLNILNVRQELEARAPQFYISHTFPSKLKHQTDDDFINPNVRQSLFFDECFITNERWTIHSLILHTDNYEPTTTHMLPYFDTIISFVPFLSYSGNRSLLILISFVENETE